MSSGRPILVTGAHRSGTTWVGKMLALAPGVGYVHEPFSPLTRPGSARAVRPLLHLRHGRERGAYEPFLARTLALRLRPRAAARAIRAPPRDAAPRRPRRRRLRARPRRARAAAHEGPDRALLGRVARRAVRDGRRRHDPPPGRVRAQPEAARLDARLRRLPRGRAAPRPPRPFEDEIRAQAERPGDVLEPGDPALADLLPPSTATASGTPTGSSSATRTSRATRSASFERLYDRLGLDLTRPRAPRDRALERRRRTRPRRARSTTSASTAAPTSAAGARTSSPAEIERIRERTQDVWPLFYADEDW